jgi:predicted LPLAT superfamily acyltransferase/GT2 family glycosyltransferase
MSDSRQTSRFCVIIPVYNHADTLGSVVGKCLDQGLPVVVVDDGSTDGSADTVAGRQNVTVRRIGTNRGKGNALREGFRAAEEMGFTHGVTCDADGQHDPAQIPLLVGASEAHPRALIIGARRMAEGGAPGISRFGRAFSNFWFLVQTLRRVEDAQSGFRVYPVAVFNRLGTVCDRYELEHEVLVRAAFNGIDILSVPVDVAYGAGIRSHFRKFRDNARFSILNAALVLVRYSGLFLFMRRGDMGKESWYRQKTLGNRFGYEWFRHLYRIAGRKGAYAWLRLVVFYYTLFAPDLAKRASLAYLARRFPDLSRKRLAAHRREHFWQFGQTILDRLIIAQGGFQDFEMRSDGLEHIREAVRHGKGLLLLGAHIGNFEVGGFALADTGVRITIVGVRKEIERVETYLHARYRDGRLPMDTLTLQDDDSFSFLEIPRALQRGEVLAMLADRKWGGRFVTHPLLGRDVDFPAGPFIVASITGSPIVTWFVVKDAPDAYHFYAMAPVVVEKAARKERERVVREAVARYAADLETILEKYPFQWYNFYDFWEEGI